MAEKSSDRPAVNLPFKRIYPRQKANRPPLERPFTSSSWLTPEVLEHAGEGVMALDSQFNYTYVNHLGAQLLGRTPAELVGQNLWDEYPGSSDEPFATACRQALLTQQPSSQEMYSTYRQCWFLTRIYPARQGIVIFFADISEQKRGLEERKREGVMLQRINRELRAVTACNQALVRAEDERSLLEEICRIVVEQAGYRMAWVGFAELDEAKSIRPAAWAGFEDGYLSLRALTWSGAENGCGMAGASIRTGTTVCVQDFASDPLKLLLREEALRRGYGSGISLPLKDEHSWTFGALLIYSSEVRAFHPDEIRLLEDLAGDLAFGIAHLRARQERQYAARALQESEERFRSLVEQSSEGVILVDEDGRVIEWNRKQAEITGIPSEQAIGRFAWEMQYQIVPNEQRSNISLEIYKRVIQSTMRDSGTSMFHAPIEVEIQTARGERRTIVQTAFPINTENGLRIGAVIRDISERKQVENALHAAKSRLEALINGSPLAISLVDSQDIVEVWNPAAEQIFGWSASEVLGKPNPIIAPNMRAEYARLMSQIYLDRKLINFETVRQRKDGTPISISLSSALLSDAEGKATGRIGIITDITEKKHAEEALRQRNTELSVLNQIGQALSKLSDPERIFERICTEIGRVLDNRNLYIALYDPARQLVTFPVYRVNGEAVLGGQRPLANGVTDRIILSNQPLLIQNDLEGTLRQMQINPRGDLSRSYIGVPMRAGDQVIGVIALQDYERENLYDEHHLELLATIAAQAGIALENARLFSAVQQELEERKRTEAALRESDARFSIAFQDAPVLITISDMANGTYVDVNDEALRVSGFSREEIIGVWFHQTGWISLENSRRLLNELKMKGRIEAMEMEFRKKDGSPMIGLFNGDVITVNGRKCLVTVTVDITERKRAEEALRHSQEQFQAVVQSASEAIVTLDTHQRIALWNAAAEMIYGYTAKEMIGQTIDALVPEWLQEKNHRFIERLFARGETRHISKILETTGLDKSGREIPIEMSLAVWRTQAGAFLTAIVHDISGRKRREHELKAITQLSAALRTVSTRADMLPVLVQQIVNSLGWDAVTIEIIDPESGDTVTEAGYGAWEALIGTRQKKGVGLNSVVHETSALYRTNSLENDPHVAFPEWARQGIGGSVGLPLLAQEKLIGFIWVGRKRNELRESEMRLLSAIADIAANAIHRTTLHEQTRQDAADLARAYASTLEGWARALELRHEETEGHTRRVAEMTLRLARRMKIPEQDLTNIWRGALLHDIGKMAIPDTVLLKPGPLNEREWEIMRQHPLYAIQMLQEIEYLQPSLNIPLYHHEKWDGSGYPSGLKGEEIPLEARIFAIIDVWDALTSDRVYRPAWTPQITAKYIREQSGKQFDPAVVEAFFQEEEE